MVKNIFNSTIVNYVLVIIGTFLVSKGFITVDLWEVFRGALEQGILVGVSGGGLVAIIVGAARGIVESQKSKVSIGGERITLPTAVTENMTAKDAKDILIGRVTR